MSDCRNPGGRWPPAEIMHRAILAKDTGPIPFVDTEAAARHLALTPTRSNATARSAVGRPSTNSGGMSDTRCGISMPGRPSIATSKQGATDRGDTDDEARAFLGPRRVPSTDWPAALTGIYPQRAGG